MEIVYRDLKGAEVVILTRFTRSFAHRPSNEKADELETPNPCKDTLPNRGRVTFFSNAVFVANKMCCVLNNNEARCTCNLSLGNLLDTSASLCV